MPVNIREAAPGEEALVLPLLRELHALHAEARADIFQPPDDGALLDDLRAMQAEDGGCLLLAVDLEGGVLGYLLYAIEVRPERPLVRARRWGVLHHIAVDAGHRREGIALALIDAMRGRLRAAGVERMHTNWWAFNAASAAMMRKAGFVPYITYADAPVG